MRIYTEVIFEWNDKQNQLVETSSKSFDYHGEMALCKKSWKEYPRWDSAGNKYTIRLKGQEYLGQWKTEYTEVKDRLIAFRSDYPQSTISTEIPDFKNVFKLLNFITFGFVYFFSFFLSFSI